MPKSKITRSEADVALRAYQIWEEEGKPDGKDFEHWLKAEAEIATPKKTAARKPAAKKATATKAKPAAKPKAAAKTATKAKTAAKAKTK